MERKEEILNQNAKDLTFKIMIDFLIEGVKV